VPPERMKNCSIISNCVYDKQALIGIAKRWFRENGEPPTSLDWAISGSLPSPTTVKKYFGSWNNLIKEAGFNPRPQYGNSYKNMRLLFDTLTDKINEEDEYC